MSHHELGAELNWTCGYSPTGPLECLDVATWHGFKLTDDGLHIAWMMASCDDHRAAMKADYSHPMASACAITGSRFIWPENYCYVEWGDHEHELIAEAPVPAAARRPGH